MSNGRMNKNSPPLYVAGRKDNTMGIEPSHMHYYITDINTNTTTTLLKTINYRCLVIYISLKRTHDSKGKLFGCRTGELGPEGSFD
jgi:hypothetical protein